jgi:glycosyltransferase involved in cell wall biosynthesis
MADRRPGPILFAMTHSSAGGLREIWNDVAGGLADRGHSVERFVLYPPDDPAAEAVDRESWHHVVERRPRSPIAALRMLVALIRYLRRVRPSAIVTAMPAANVILPVAVTIARVPTHVFPSHHSPTGTHNPMLDRFDGWSGMLPCVERIVSVSHAVAATLSHKTQSYRRKSVTIHNALPEHVEQRVDALARGSAERPAARIVALGRLTYQKNYPMLLHAVAAAPDATLDIVGGGEDERELRALAQSLGIADRIRFLGLVPREEALSIASAAGIFCQVSRYEGHSLALIEAARMALPLIVSDVPVQVEGITAADGTRCGIVVPLGDSDALARALNTLIADPEARAHWSALAARLGHEASRLTMLDRYEALLAPPPTKSGLATPARPR